MDFITTDDIQHFLNICPIIYEMVEYQGFSPRVTAQLVLNKITDKEDLLFLVSLAVMKGNNIQKILKTLKGEAVKSLIALRSRPNIVNNIAAGGGTPRMKIITQNRISQAFPILSCWVNAKLARDPLKHVKELEHMSGFMRCSAFASMIPLGNGPAEIAVKRAFLVYQALLSSLVQEQRRKKKHSVNYKTCESFVNGTLRSSYVPEDSKIRCQIKWEIMNEAGEVRDNVLRIAEMIEMPGFDSIIV